MQKHEEIIIQESSLNNLQAITRIYRDAFPDNTRAILGEKICDKYFSLVIKNENYKLFEIMVSNTVTGFCVFHCDIKKKSIGRKWMLQYFPILLIYVVKRPFLMARGFNRLFLTVKRKFQKREGKKEAVSNSTTGYIDLVAIHKKFKRNGFGRLLIEKCIEYAKGQNIQRIGLTVRKNNKSAIDFYNVLGFSTVEADKDSSQCHYLYTVS